MHRSGGSLLLAALAAGVLLSCSQPRPQSAGATGPRDGPTQAAGTSTLVMTARAEMPSLSARPVRDFGLGGRSTVSLFSRGLAIKDASGTSQPYLAERLPVLNTDSWRVFQDGGMETTYRLRPNLTWHDGSPLTSEDFKFGWTVYRVP